MKNSATICIFFSFLLLLQTFNGVKAGFLCVGSSILSNSSYLENRDTLFSSLSSNVITNRGFYNGSLDRAHTLALCRRGFERQACINCIEKAIREIKRSCPDKVESFNWDGDGAVSCLVRTTDRPTFRILALGPVTNDPSDIDLDSSTKNMTLFRQEWETTVNRTLEAATAADPASVLKYYGAVHAEFMEFPNVYMMMQCTPDITSGECKQCLGECVKYFRDFSWGKQGGTIGRPICVFRWDLYSFYGAFANITRVPAPPRPLLPQAQATSASGMKGRIILIVVVPTVINFIVLIGLIRAYGQMRKPKNETSGMFTCFSINILTHPCPCS